jgi:hypothetical protein
MSIEPTINSVGLAVIGFWIDKAYKLIRPAYFTVIERGVSLPDIELPPTIGLIPSWSRELAPGLILVNEGKNWLVRGGQITIGMIVPFPQHPLHERHRIQVSDTLYTFHKARNFWSLTDIPFQRS